MNWFAILIKEVELILRAQEAIDKEDWEEYERIRDLVRKTYEGENNS